MDTPDRFVHGAELREREGVSDEGGRDPGVLELDLDAGDRVANDSLVVEGEVDRPVEDVRRRRERGMGRVRSGREISHLAQHRQVRDRHDVHARIPSWVAVRPELVQERRPVEARFLGELARCGLVERLVRPLEAAGYRPHPFVRRHAATHEQHVQSAVLHREDDHVDRDGESRELRRVVVLRDAGVGASAHAHSSERCHEVA